MTKMYAIRVIATGRYWQSRYSYSTTPRLFKKKPTAGTMRANLDGYELVEFEIREVSSTPYKKTP